MPVPSRPAPDRVFEGQPDFDERLLPELRAIRFFRLATGDEIDHSFDAGPSGDPARLVTAWAEVADPVRATMTGIHAVLYRQVGLLPRRLLGLSFLSMTRGVLEAGRQVRAQLRPEVTQVIASEFPWLELRHEHIPPGWAPAIEFPPAFAKFLEGGTLDDTRARWQLLTALNEVQQAHSSKHMARLFRLEELSRHADRERDLALNYFTHWWPRPTRTLWAQCIYILDGLNAAVFAALAGSTGHAIRAHAAWGMIAGGAEWRAFREGLDRPQKLLDPDSLTLT